MGRQTPVLITHHQTPTKIWVCQTISIHTTLNAFVDSYVFFYFSLLSARRIEVDLIPNRKTSKSGVERMLEFGRELFQMSQRLEKENGANETNRKMLEVSMQQTKKNNICKAKNGSSRIAVFLFVLSILGCIQFACIFKSLVQSYGMAAMSFTA